MNHSISRSLLVVSLLLTGCGTTKYTVSSQWPYIETQVVEDQDLKPRRIVAIWSPDVVQTAGKKPTQGFTGRLFFYNKRNKPIKVDGELAVYGYDDTGARDQEWEGSDKPDRKFIITKEQLPGHFGENKIGASYSIWIPWQQLGGVRKAISLVPVLTNSDGIRVVGPPTRNLLPGKDPHKEQPRVIAQQDKAPVVFPNADDLRQLIHDARTNESMGVGTGGLNQQALPGAIGAGATPTSTATSSGRKQTMTIDLSRNLSRAYVNRQNSSRTRDKAIPNQIAKILADLPVQSMPAAAQAEEPEAQQEAVTGHVGLQGSSAARRWQPTLRPSSIRSNGYDASWESFHQRR